MDSHFYVNHLAS
ncbi:leader peptide MgtM [Salmonella enterica subsp. enterica serovar Typhimurium var. monophasic 4,5,12:i:-]|nr:leader peptide MgtM [Salmonella enterica subsp. enterica serovar Typhimurium var. monophasic 4,5,12:i:-]